MTLKKIDVSEVGLVRYATEHGSMVRITAECPDKKMAVYFELKPLLAPRVGEWIYIEGFGKVDSRKPPESSTVVLLHDRYMHDPHDGTSKDEWVFLEMREFSWRHVPPGPLAGQMAQVKERVDTHLTAWTVTKDSRSLWESVRIIDELRKTLAMSAVVAERDEDARAAKPAIVEIEI